MIVQVRSPLGQITSLDLNQTAVFRLSMRAIVNPCKMATAEGEDTLALTLDYVAGGAITWMVIVGMHVGEYPTEIAQVAKVGFPFLDLPHNRERVREALSVLHNSDMTGKDVEAILAKGTELASIYHHIQDLIWAPKGALMHVQKTSGTLDGWHYAVTTDRFASFLEAPPVALSGAGPGDAPAVEKPKEVPPKAPPKTSREARRKQAEARALSADVPDGEDDSGDTTDGEVTLGRRTPPESDSE